MNGRSPLQPTRDAARERLKQLGVREGDLAESFARSSGPGGQHVNKVSTAVTLRHLPSGLSVTVQDSRSQAMNRQLARERLADLIARRAQERKAAAKQAREKKRRQKAPRPPRLKKRILEGKRRRGAAKKLRGRIDDE